MYFGIDVGIQIYPYLRVYLYFGLIHPTQNFTSEVFCVEEFKAAPLFHDSLGR